MNQNDQMQQMREVLRRYDEFEYRNVAQQLNKAERTIELFRQALAQVNKTPESGHVEPDVLNKAGNVGVMRKALQEAADLLEAIPPVIEACEKVQADIYEMRIKCQQALAAQAAPTERASLRGDSMFETWFSTYDPSGKGDKQRARDAYAAGMSEFEPAPLVRLTDEEQTKIVRLFVDCGLGDWQKLWQCSNAIMDAMERVNRRQLDQTPNSPSE